MAECNHIVGEIVESHDRHPSTTILWDRMERGAIPNIIFDFCSKCGARVREDTERACNENYEKLKNG